jgi:carboxymethylenebutenolidase
MLLAMSFAVAQDWAKKRLETSPRHQEWVDIKNGSRTVKAFVMYPERKDKAPVVILIHEIFGLSDWAMSMADQLAEKGYIAIAPDLLSGMAPNGGRTTDFTDATKITETVSGLPQDQVTGDLNAVADYAKTIPSASGKLYVAGFCWGGKQAFTFATNRHDLSGAFVFYGFGPTDPADVARITAPVYGFYGGNDNRINATLEDQKKAMAAASKPYEVVIYEGAGHGFMRAGEVPDATPENAKAREAAWKKWLEVMGRVPTIEACCETSYSF